MGLTCIWAKFGEIPLETREFILSDSIFHRWAPLWSLASLMGSVRETIKGYKLFWNLHYRSLWSYLSMVWWMFENDVLSTIHAYYELCGPSNDDMQPTNGFSLINSAWNDKHVINPTWVVLWLEWDTTTLNAKTRKRLFWVVWIYYSKPCSFCILITLNSHQILRNYV